MSTSPAHARRPAGTPTGGQFAPEAHAEPEVTLGARPPEPESTQTTDEFGTIRWHNAKGQLHRTDGPAVEYADGDRQWHVNGQLHRTDGPAVEYADGPKQWYVDGQRHRLDGPAIEWADGGRQWYVDGQRHRLDGPAIEWADGGREWWLHGLRLTEPEFRELTAQASTPHISFTATSLREHFAGDHEIEPLLDGLTDAEIEAEADAFLSAPAADGIWGAFHLAACDIVRAAARPAP